MVLEEGRDQLLVLSGRFAENCLLRAQVESPRKLPQRALFQQLLDVAIDRVRPARQLLPTVDVARTQMPFDFLELGQIPKIGKNVQNARFFIEQSCKRYARSADRELV